MVEGALITAVRVAGSVGWGLVLSYVVEGVWRRDLEGCRIWSNSNIRLCGGSLREIFNIIYTKISVIHIIVNSSVFHDYKLNI